MKASYSPKQWRELYARCKTHQERGLITGVPPNLAARLLGISPSRIFQLIHEEKLDSISVRDESGRRIANMITLASLDRRRTIRRNRGQWQPRETV